MGVGRGNGLGALKQPPSLPVGLTPHQRLDLAPIPALTGAIRGIAALANYAFEAALLGHAEQRQAVFEWFGQ